MPETTWTEVPLFIHGITPGEEPGSHDGDYKALLGLVNGELASRGKPALPWAEAVRVEWGWESGQSAENDRFLAQAEKAIGREAFAAQDAAWDFTLNPARALHSQIRKSFLYGFSDLFYYVSQDGERAVRNHVFGQISQRLNALPAGQNLSLTLFTHSAGTVIAHDLLYHLFGSTAKAAAGVQGLQDLHGALAALGAGRLRVRRLFTMGSPITPLIFRADALLLKAANGQKLDPADLGLAADPALPGPRWVNFWDKDDVISYPLAFNYLPSGGAPVVEDCYTDIGDFFPAVHGQYWTASPVAARMAEVW